MGRTKDALPETGGGQSHTALFLVLAAGIIFYLPGLLPGRVLLPADILCGVLPWHATEQCAGRTPANPVISDQVFQFFAWRSVVQKHGWSAVFWNPYAFAGSPMAGNGQAALFYPPNWLHFVLPPSWSYVILALFRTSIAAIFSYFFARGRLSSTAAALAAAAYVFSFTFVFSIGYPLGDALTWMPVLFWAVEVRRPVALAAATGFELLSGQSEAAVAAFTFLLAYFVWRRPSRREIARAGLAVSAGAAVAAPQLFLLYRYLGESAASPLRSEFQPLFYSAHTLLEFLTPAFFGTSSPHDRWASIDGAYFGLIAALLALSWIVAQPRDAARSPFLWMFALSLAFIYAVPPFIWVLQLPVLRSMFVLKFWGTATFAGAMLAGNGWDSYRKGRVSWRLLAWVGSLFIVVVLGARWSFNEFVYALNLVSFENRVLGAFAISVFLSLLVLRRRPTLAVFLLIAESYYYLANYNVAAPASLLYPRTPVVEFLARDPERFRIIGSGVFPANTAGIYGFEDVRGYDALTPRRYFEYMASIDTSFPDFYAHFNPNPPRFSREALSYRDAVERPTRYWGPAFTSYLKRVFYWNEQLTQLERPALLDLLNVKYYVVAHGSQLPNGAKDYRLVYSGEVDAYENAARLPRAFVVPRWEMVADEKTALGRIRAPDFNPRLRAILCSEAGGHSGQSLDGQFREAEILRYEPNQVIIRAAGPGVLVLADSYFPGWTAAGFHLYQADYLFRGVVLGEGPQTVTFSFQAFGR